MLTPNGSAGNLERNFFWWWLGRWLRVKEDSSKEAGFKWALESGQGFNRQRLGMQEAFWRPRGTGQRREDCEAPSGSQPSWAGVAEAGEEGRVKMGRRKQHAPISI